MDDLQFDLGDEWSSMMLNDLDTSVFGEENELGDDLHGLSANITCTKKIRPASTITTPPVKSLEISDNATINVQSGSSTSCIVGAPSNVFR